MMSDKRFECVFVKGGDGIFRRLKDNETNLTYMTCDVADLLNFQDTQIKCLKEENEQLREINKEIGDDLYNCRLNKKIISKILKLWQNTLAKYDIYTIKDFVESFELDAKISNEKDEKIKELKKELNDCEKIRYSVFEKMNELNYIQSDPVTLKKYKELFDDE